MPTAPETYYLTAAEYALQTKVSTLFESLTDAEVDELLLETMALIDAYVGEGWVPYDDDQEFIFPRCQDEDSSGNPEIPRPVSLATRIIADAILEERDKGVLPHQVASEGNLGHSFTKHARTIQPELGFEVIPPQAIALLQKYRRVGGYMGVNEPVCDTSVL